MAINEFPIPTRTVDVNKIQEAIDSADLAQAWAESDFEPGGPGSRSAKQWSEIAEGAASGSSAPFATRQAFIDGNIPAPLSRASFFVNGNTYAVVRDPSGPIVQANGQRWRPDGDVTPQHFGAVGDGVADDTAAVQTAINYCNGNLCLIVPPGEYLATELTYPATGLIMRGVYPSSIIRQGIPTPRSLLQALSFTSGSSHVNISGIVFDGGDQALPANIAMVRMPETDSVNIVQCWFRNYRWTLASITGASASRVDRCVFSEWGSPDPANTGSNPGIFVGQNNATGTGGDEAHITNSEFRNGQWVAIYCYARKSVIAFNEIRDVQEAGIFSFRERTGDPASADAEDLIVMGNNISNITAQFISAAGMEIGAKRAVVMGNVIENVESSGIKVLDVGESVIVSGNVIENSVRDPIEFPSHGQIEVVVSNETTLFPTRVQITNNIITDTASPKVAPYAISVRRYSGTETVSSIRITGNSVADGFLTQAIFLASGVVDPSGASMIFDNENRGGTVSQPLHILRRTAGDLFTGVDVDDTNNGGFSYYKNGVLRWQWLITNTETMELRRYNESGVLQATTLQAQPNTNGVLFAGRVTAASFSNNGPLILSGAGSPEGAVAGGVGSIYQRTDGGAGTSFYVKESGTGSTGWVPK